MDELTRLGTVFLARRRKAAEHLREFNITLPQMHLIQLARQKGAITPSAAAEEMACDRPTLTLIAEKCLAQGWLAKKRHTRDRRSYRLELTGEGEELLDRIERSKRLSGLALGDPLDVLGPDEREFFRSCLVKIEARAKELYRL